MPLLLLCIPTLPLVALALHTYFFSTVKVENCLLRACYGARAPTNATSILKVQKRPSADLLRLDPADEGSNGSSAMQSFKHDVLMF